MKYDLKSQICVYDHQYLTKTVGHNMNSGKKE
jgi:hypothetical protein